MSRVHGSRGHFKMSDVRRHGVIVGASSDIGLAIARDWIDRGIAVVGTYRKESPQLFDLRSRLAGLSRCDFSDPDSIRCFTSDVAAHKFQWDYLVICPGTMEPIGLFTDVNIDAWCTSFELNFLSTMRVVHSLLPLRACQNKPLVLLFSGAGTNSAPPSFSAYTVAKIALIKAIELLDVELPDVRFTIIGPGWVRTKIHQETLRSVDAVPEAASETTRRLENNDFNPLSRVVQCVSWAMNAPKDVVGGRNFSVVHDDWGTAALERQLRADVGAYKLRRARNRGS